MASAHGPQPTPSIKVAFLGPLASYSHQAALNRFSDSDTFELEPRATIADVFDAVQNGDTQLGVVPFENSIHGSVVQTLDLFSDRPGRLPDIAVCGETHVEVEHCLLGLEDGVKNSGCPTPGIATPTIQDPAPSQPRSHPLTDISHIKHIYSHPQAFGQTSDFTNAYLRNAEIHDVSSTSRGAEIVVEQGDPCRAAIASKTAAKVHNLKVLARSINNLDDNATRFFIIKGTKSTFPNIDQKSSDSLRWKSLIGFGIDHAKPGALADALSVFKKQGLNLTSINSRPSHRRRWHYFFLVEFEGNVEEADMAHKSLLEFTEESRSYGSWRYDDGSSSSAETTAASG